MYIEKSCRGGYFMKIFNRALDILMCSSVFVYIVYCIYKYIAYNQNPEIYMLYSAPWYTDIVLYGGILLLTLFVCLVVKIILYYKVTKPEMEKKREVILAAFRKN